MTWYATGSNPFYTILELLRIMGILIVEIFSLITTIFRYTGLILEYLTTVMTFVHKVVLVIHEFMENPDENHFLKMIIASVFLGFVIYKALMYALAPKPRRYRVNDALLLE